MTRFLHQVHTSFLFVCPVPSFVTWMKMETRPESEGTKLHCNVLNPVL